MPLLPAIVLLSSPEAANLAAKLEATHGKMTSANVVVVDALMTAIPTKVSYKAGACTIAMPNQQIAEVRSTSVRFYDEIFNQVASAKPAKGMKVPDQAYNVAFIHREALAWLLDGKQRSTFFTEIKRDPRWMVRSGKLELRDVAKKLHSEVAFDTDFRVTAIKLTINSKPLTDWRFRYVDAKQIPSIPVNAKNVKGLPERPNLPSKSNGLAVLMAQKVWRAMSRLEGKTVIQSNSEGTYRLTVKKTGLMEQGPSGTWSVDGATLTVAPKKGDRNTYTKDVSRFADKLQTAGIEPSPFAYYYLNRKVPYLDIFDRCTSIELENGSMSLQGRPCKILKVIRNANRIRLYVDEQNGNLLMIGNDAVDAQGNLVSSSRLKVSYQ